MTVITVNPADLGDDLTLVASEVGVFVSDVEYRILGPDETGGLDRLTEILREKTDATDTVVVVPSSVITRIGRAVRSAIRALVDRAKRTARACKEALAWLAAPIGAIHERAQNRRQPELYTGRHRTETAWYGAQRSTMSRVAVQRRRSSGRQPDDSEPALPIPSEYWVSHVVRAIEAVRGHEDALHPRKGYQFLCS